MTDPADNVTGLYARHGRAFDRLRDRSLSERPWLDRFLAPLAPGSGVLDLGCGAGEPIAAYLVARGFRVTGVDAAPVLLDLARDRFPDEEWIGRDMRGLALGRRFAGILAWDGFFHLTADDQRRMFPVFRDHAAPGATLLFNSGPAAGVAIGEFEGEPLHHASLDGAEYRALLAANGFTVLDRRIADPDCGGRTVWLARAG